MKTSRPSFRSKSGLLRSVLFLLPVILFLAGPLSAAGADEVLCFTERITDAPSFNIYTGRNDANNPIVWTHTVPAGILDRVVRVGLYIEAWDVDAPPVNDEHDRVLFNGYDLGLLEGFNDTWITVEKTVPVEALREGSNELKVFVDELGKDWKVTIRASELRFYCSSAQPDFSLGLSPDNLSVTQGGSAESTVTVTALNGFSQAVQLDMDSLPAGVSAVFTANPLTPSPLAQTTVQLTVASTVPVGTYALILKGRNAELERQADLQLTVEKATVEPVYSMSIGARPDSGLPPLDVTFTALFTGDEPPVGTRFSWEFGDGKTGEGSPIQHRYQRSGSYGVKLTASLPSGKSLQGEKQITVIPPDSRIDLAFSKSRASAGELLELRIAVNNPLDQDLRDLNLRLPLDPALVWKKTLKGVAPTSTARPLVWHIPLLRARESLDLTMELQVADQAKTGVISQIAELKLVGLSEPLFSDPARLEILPVVLELTKTVNKASASAGDELVYGIRLQNPGYLSLPVILEDMLPAQLDFVSAVGPLTLERQDQTLTWRGELAAGADLTWQIRALVRPDVFAGERLENTALVNSEALIQARRSNTVVTVVQGAGISESQIHLEHRAEIPQSEVGRLVRLRINLSNRSSSSLINPRLEILLPSGFDYVPGSSLLNGSKLTDPEGRGRRAYILRTLSAGQSLTLQYQVVIGTSSRRGPNLCRAELRALDGARNEVLRTADARISVSAGGLVFMSGLEGQVFLDRDGDGFYAGPDQPLPGIEVMLSSGERTQTDAMGQFRLSGLYPGEYLVGINRAGLDERYRLPQPQSRLVVLSDGLTDFVDLPVLFADQTQEELSRLEGRVFYDKNQDGLFTPGLDPLVEGFTVLLDGQAMTRGQGGRFVFTRLTPGAHHLEIRTEGKTHVHDLTLNKGPQIVEFPLIFSGIRITIQGEKK